MWTRTSRVPPGRCSWPPCGEGGRMPQPSGAGEGGQRACGGVEEAAAEEEECSRTRPQLEQRRGLMTPTGRAPGWLEGGMSRRTGRAIRLHSRLCGARGLSWDHRLAWPSCWLVEWLGTGSGARPAGLATPRFALCVPLQALWAGDSAGTGLVPWAASPGSRCPPLLRPAAVCLWGEPCPLICVAAYFPKVNVW